MIKPVVASALFGALLTSAAIHGVPGNHEGQKVFFQNRFDNAMGTLSQGVSTDLESGALILMPGEAGYAAHGTFVSVPARSAREFNAAMASWIAEVPEGTRLDMAFRFAQTSEGPWSRWHSMSPETEVSVAGMHRWIQFRAHLVSETGEKTPRLSSVSLHFGVAMAEPDLPAGLTVSLPRPQVTSRAQWGARPPKDEYTNHTPNRLVVHHSSSPSAANFNGASTIRGIQNYHMDAPSHGWIDIGYHFLIAPDGTIYEGRPETVSGAHVIPNPNKIGICMIGNFQSPATENPTEAQRAKLLDLLSHLAGKYGISPDGIGGHRDYMQTDCPGERLYEELPRIRAEVQERIDAVAER